MYHLVVVGGGIEGEAKVELFEGADVVFWDAAPMLGDGIDDDGNVVPGVEVFNEETVAEKVWSS